MLSDFEIEDDSNNGDICKTQSQRIGSETGSFTLCWTDTKDPKYTSFLKGVQSFLEASNEYLEGVEYTGSLAITALLFMETELWFTPEEEWKNGSGKKATEDFIKRLIMGSKKIRHIRHNLLAQGTNLIQNLEENTNLLSKKQNIKQQTTEGETSSGSSSTADPVKSLNEVLSKLVTLVSRDQNALSTLVTKKLCECAHERKQSEIESIVNQFKKTISDQPLTETVRKCQEQLMKLIQSIPSRSKHSKSRSEKQARCSDNDSE